jgi:monofunctional biosynthetic peptidoglycan transglycosylase
MKKIFSPAPVFRKGTPLFLRLLHGVRLAVVFFVVSTVSVVLVYRFVPPPATPLMLLRLGDQIAEGKALKLYKDWRSLEEISPYLTAAVVVAEDQRFYDHHGFDFGAIQNALRRNERARARGRTRVVGASTISQQTAKNLFLWPARSWARKGLEVYFTVLIETLWPKRRILEMYLNVAEMGPGIYGAQAASRHWFGRDARRLTRPQAARLASILPKPRSWSPVYPPRRVARREAWILQQLPAFIGRAR